jgi:ribosomal protein S18 acetylase RimI-like enzyme
VLYDIAFVDKVALGVPDKNKRLKLLKRCMLLEYAIGAFYKGKLVGIAGFHTRDGHLTGGKLKLSDMMTLLGLWGGIKAAMVLSVFSRKPDKDELLMDGISVAPSGRGKGIGSNLLTEIIKHAKENGFISVRLDVVDTNPNAKRLYKRMGFKVAETESFPRLKKYLGFGGADTMIYEVKNA